MRSNARFFAAVLVCGAQVTCAGSLLAGRLTPSHLSMPMATLGSLSATPGTITFQATNPDLGAVSGSAPGNITWIVLGGSQTQNWTVTVQAGANSFAGCPTVPISAVRVTCASATVSGSGGNGGCNGSFPLSTTPQQIAGGTQGDGANSYSVSLNFTLAESWRYVANSSCTLTLTYFVSAP